MNTSFHPFRWVALLMLLIMGVPTAKAITFTNDTAIGITNTNFDGQDIIVTNCTVTIDGLHAFASVQLLNGATLTHSFSTNGLLEHRLSIVNELHSLSSTNPTSLNQTNVLTNTVVVANLTGDTYRLGADYGLRTTNSLTLITLLMGSSIPEGATVSISYDFLGTPVAAGLLLTVSNDFQIETGAVVGADAIGFGGGLGPGAGASLATNYPYPFVAGSGGGHGGYGAPSSSEARGGNAYGSAYGLLPQQPVCCAVLPVCCPLQPPELGSGGGAGSGPGSPGGGGIRIAVGGLLRVDGRITANGGSGFNLHSGGGAGGGIWLSPQTFSGIGAIAADGGAGQPPDGGGGGGGRIVVVYSTNEFAGSISARGGASATSGGAGTIYTAAAADAGGVMIDNGGARGTNTPLSLTRGSDLTISGGAIVQSVDTAVTIGNLLINSNSWFTPPPSQSLTMTVTGNALMLSGGGITADGKGYPGGQGVGAGATSSSWLAGSLGGGGGGYGGFGGAGAYYGAAGGSYYGSVPQPLSLGSGGGHGAGIQPYSLGGAGGGLVHLTVARTLVLDGQITANGAAGTAQGSGGGSGGSVYLAVGNLAGKGIIAANGGSGEMPDGGGGGGGRIAIYCNGTNGFTGAISAHGGLGANNGSAGTIYSKATNDTIAQVIIDNAGLAATNTVLYLLQQGFYDLTISGSAIVNSAVVSPLGNLLIQSNSWLTHSNLEGSVLTVTVFSNATIQAGGGVMLDGKGYPGGYGAGVGRYSGGGGGYGGFGGGSATNSAGGGNSYGSLSTPTQVGSGASWFGGWWIDPSLRSGGSGGGGLHLSVAGTLALDGTITANGTAGSAQGGGGSGGSVLLTAGKLTGAGTISANGGAGDLPVGGGGGGGRIALYCRTNQFTGGVSAHGGAGANYGGAGTIYFATNEVNNPPHIIIDNFGWRGASTLLSNLVSINLTVTGGGAALVSAASLGPISSLFIGSNSWILYSRSNHSAINVTGNATVQAGGGIRLDGLGYASGLGPGAGTALYSYSITNGFNGYSAGGGGYGGYGGYSTFGAAGGNSYGSLTQPIDLGSGGGFSNVVGNPSNAGGGAFQLTVGGTLALDGSITANGRTALAQATGGGSGGSLWLAVGTLLGNGLIAANGGSGNLPYGGGGGGGRISIYYRTNLFNGSLSARGGAGATYGGAGTIYQAPRVNDPSAGGVGQVLVDNGGQRGTNTGLGTSGLFDLMVSNGAILTPPLTSTFRNLLIASNAWLTASSGQVLQLITSNAVIQAGGGITMVGQGSPGGRGPGFGGLTNTQAYGYTGGGGGHGGHGGASVANASGGDSYDSILRPTNQGSGGGPPRGSAYLVVGGAGGGVMKLSVTGTLTLDGRISADGANASYENAGGGSGGSIWLTAGTLSGSGLISASGGAGGYPQGGGGGGGGRIAVYCATNLLSGKICAFGGAGATYGGAGTIYTRANSDAVGRLLIDNAGSDGTNTPLTAPEAFTLTISGGAVVHPSGPGLVLGGLLVDSGATLTQLTAQSNLDLLVLGNAVVQTNGSLSVDAKGYGGDAGGPGAGQMFANTGSGGGYGGIGGASASGTPGGSTYGSATQPIDFGSGGGLSPAYPGFSQGGGAVLMRVSGTLTVNGDISANGNSGLVEGAGGGAGGSLWLTARALDGFGSITANGGQGEAYGGGGGGGGRIAIYSRTNNFAGATSAAGGAGANPGQDGTLLITNISAPQIIAQFPVGVVNSMVSYVDLTFGSPMNLGTASSADFALDTPNGFVPNNTLTVSAADLSGVRLGFPDQNAVGYYQVQAGPQIEDIYGQPMAGAYTGSFVILAPAISGRVLDANGLPVSYVTLRPNGGLLPEVTDNSGSYSLEVPPSWAGTLTPSKGAALFLPASNTYTNVTANLTNQNFILFNSEALTLTSQKQGPNLILAWYGINGVSYQLVYSSDLVNWLPLDSGLLLGTNGPMTLPLPIGSDKAKFFRFSASY